MFIVIEGIDGAGKATQTRMLRDRLANSGYDVSAIAFPRYGEWSSVFVERYLHGELGDPSTIDPYIASAMYTLDRYAYRSTLERELRVRDFVVSDRYGTASFFHRGGDVLARSDRTSLHAYLDWLYDFEFVRAGLPLPDIVCLLAVDAETVRESILRRAAEEDRTIDTMDTDIDHQMRASRLALEVIPRYFPPCVIIPCEDGEGNRTNPMDTHERIYSAVLARYEELHPVRRIDDLQ